MTVNTQALTATRLIITMAAIAGLILAAFAVATPALAGHTGPLVVPTATGQSTNYDCDDLVEHDFIEAFDDEDQSGESPSGNGSDEHVSWNVTGSVVSFAADSGWLVIAVNVKGGQQGGNVYDYEPLGGVDHDNGLVTPNNPNGAPAGVSHIVFCLIHAPATPTPTPEPPEISLFLVPCEGPNDTPRVRVIALVLLGLHLFLDGNEVALDGNGEAEVAPDTYAWSVENDDEDVLASGQIIVAPCTTGVTPTPTPEGSQAGGTGTPAGTPAGSIPDTSTSLAGFSGPLATLVFGLILLGSLGALAYANVATVRRRS